MWLRHRGVSGGCRCRGWRAMAQGVRRAGLLVALDFDPHAGDTFQHRLLGHCDAHPHDIELPQDAVRHVVSQGLDQIVALVAQTTPQVFNHRAIVDRVSNAVAGSSASTIDVQIDVEQQRRSARLLVLVHPDPGVDLAATDLQPVGVQRNRGVAGQLHDVYRMGAALQAPRDAEALALCGAHSCLRKAVTIRGRCSASIEAGGMAGMRCRHGVPATQAKAGCQQAAAGEPLWSADL